MASASLSSSRLSPLLVFMCALPLIMFEAWYVVSYNRRALPKHRVVVKDLRFFAAVSIRMWAYFDLYSAHRLAINGLVLHICCSYLD